MPSVKTFALFLTFSKITLSGFGGIMFWARRELVERRHWLTDRDFAELLTLGEVLPGAPGLNLTAMVGYRFAGWRGAAVSVAGLVGGPFFVVIGMGVLYQHYGSVPQVQQALTGMSAVAAGLLAATAIKLAAVLQRRVVAWLFVGLAFAGIGVLRWPFLWVVGLLAPFAVAWGFRQRQ